ncbi:TPA: hypothetical protein ACIRVE_005099 [Pseudomonas putida]
MTYKGFRIENTPAYIWRIYCWGSHAGHNHVACWYVFDAEGKRVTGGYTSGNNTRSGTVDLARRKDAKAWVDGYCAYRDEPENRQLCANGTAVYAPHYARHVSDTELEASFDAGYWDAQRAERQQASRLAG